MRDRTGGRRYAFKVLMTDYLPSVGMAGNTLAVYDDALSWLLVYSSVTVDVVELLVITILCSFQVHAVDWGFRHK